MMDFARRNQLHQLEDELHRRVTDEVRLLHSRIAATFDNVHLAVTSLTQSVNQTEGHIDGHASRIAALERQEAEQDMLIAALLDALDDREADIKRLQSHLPAPNKTEQRIIL